VKDGPAAGDEEKLSPEGGVPSFVSAFLRSCLWVSQQTCLLVYELHSYRLSG
jgi:hypothetical protein